MADHSNNNPITGLLGMLVGSVTGIYGAIFLTGLAMGAITGNVPIRGSLLNPWETGQYVGGLFNAGGNSGIQTFGSEEYFQNSKRIGDGASNPRLIVPNRPSNPNTLPLPASDRRTTSDLSGATATPVTYKDLDGDGIITPDEIAKQNKN